MANGVTLGPVTQSFVRNLCGQDRITPAVVADFGLDSGEPFGKFNGDIYRLYVRGWLRKLFTAEELDAAMGKGPELTKLLQRVDPKATVKTVWDNMRSNDLEEAKG